MKVKSVNANLALEPRVIPISSFIPIGSSLQISLILKKPFLCFY